MFINYNKVDMDNSVRNINLRLGKSNKCHTNRRNRAYNCSPRRATQWKSAQCASYYEFIRIHKIANSGRKSSSR